MRKLRNLYGALMLLVTALTLTGCGNGDNALEEIINGGGGSSTPKSAGAISYATTSLLRGSKDPSFTNALTLTGDGTVSYSSSNPSVATVDATGKVTPVAVGTTTITATISDSESYTYATKQVSYTIELQEGYSYREWDTVDKKYVTSFVPSDNCELITSSTTTLDGSKRYVVVGDVNVAHDIEITASSTIILCDNAELNINGRLHSNQLYICAQSEGEEMGKLSVTTDTGTGEGVLYSTSNIIIHGGNITAMATGNTCSLYGIRAIDDIYIYGGYIKAQGNGDQNAGICIHDTKKLYIYGGEVIAIGLNHGSYGVQGNVEVSGTGTLKATGAEGYLTGPSSGYAGGHGIRGSLTTTADSSGDITITGGNGVSTLSSGSGVYTDVIANGSGAIEITGGNGNDSGNGGIAIYGSLTANGSGEIIVKGGNSIAAYGAHGVYKYLTTGAECTSKITITGGDGASTKYGGHGIVGYGTNHTTLCAINYSGGTVVVKGGNHDGTLPPALGEGSTSNHGYIKTSSATNYYTWDGTTWTSAGSVNGVSAAISARGVALPTMPTE